MNMHRLNYALDECARIMEQWCADKDCECVMENTREKSKS